MTPEGRSYLAKAQEDLNDGKKIVVKPEKRAGFWSLVSDDESVERGQVNFWAMAETALAIVIFWYVALNWETAFVLYLSCCIAPMLLLRSETSLKQGVIWFGLGFLSMKFPDWAALHKGPKNSLRKRGAWIRAAIGFFVVIAFIYFWDWLWLPQIEVSDNFLYRINTSYSIVLLAVGGASIGAGYNWRKVVLLQFLVTSAVVISLCVRILATFRYIYDGYASIPTNIRHLSLFTAPFHAPELLPGLPKPHNLRLAAVYAQGRKCLISRDVGKFFYGLLTLFILAYWFFVGWAYRFILKSTLWLWWILFFIGGAPNIIGGVNGLRADAYRKWWAWIAIALSLLTLGGLLFAPWIRVVIASKQGADPLPVSVALLFLVNWRAVSVFQGLALITSALTLATVLWAQSLAVDHAEVPGRGEAVNRQLPWVGYVIKLKTGLGFASIALTMAYIALYFNAVEWNHPVSAYAYNWLVWLYGLNAPALLPVGTMRV